jgi:HAD superfamily hydrolase (TIGR01509 family)
MGQMQAVLFDMDGTIIDSEPYWFTAERELVESFGGTWSDEQAFSLVGNGLWDSAAVLKTAGVQLELDEIVHNLSDRVLAQIESAVPWRSGIRELFTSLLADNIPCALVTMSLRKNALAVAAAVERELGQPVFAAVIGGDDVDNPKPHPEPYLRGAAALGVDVRNTVAFEDSIPGATSAFVAGAVTIGVPLLVEILHDCVHEIWTTLENKTALDLHESWQRHRGEDAL